MSATAPASRSPRVTAPSLRAMKEAGRPIVMLTAYDYHGARLVEAAAVDAVLVGDSLGMTVLGLESTLAGDDGRHASRNCGGVAGVQTVAHHRRHAVHVVRR